MKLLDILFPKYCVNCKRVGDYLCANCFSRLSYDTKNICLSCGKPSYNSLTHPKCRGKYRIDGAFTGVVFNPISKKLIYQLKYKPYLKDLGSIMSDLLYESLIQNEEFDKILKQVQDDNAKVQDDIIFVPIPLSKSRFRKRGYNQAEILSKNLSKKFGFLAVDGLEKIRETKSQVGLSKEERKENIADAFRLKEQFKAYIKNKNAILIDDVLTTGSTLYEAGKILKKGGAVRVFGVAFAREQKD